MEQVFYNRPDECSENSAVCRNTSQGSPIKIAFIQHVHVLQLWFNVTSKATCKSRRTTT